MLTHDRDTEVRSWYLWVSTFTLPAMKPMDKKKQREALDVHNTFDFAWRGDSNNELLFLTNQGIVMFRGGEGKCPVICQVNVSENNH